MFAVKENVLHPDDIVLAEEALRSKLVFMRAWTDPMPNPWITLDDLHHRCMHDPSMAANVALCKGPFAVD